MGRQLYKENTNIVSYELALLTIFFFFLLHLMQDLPLLSSGFSSGFLSGSKRSIWQRLKDASHQIIEELLAPPTVSAVCF
jgi:hypothetical protein